LRAAELKCGSLSIRANKADPASQLGLETMSPRDEVFDTRHQPRRQA